jgi:hypothetical protein
MRQRPTSNEQSRPTGQFAEALSTVAKTVINPLFLFGGVFGSVIGAALCWVLLVLPIHKNLSEREAQLEKWSELNQQLQKIAMENRELSQNELKQFVAENQQAAVSFSEVQSLLRERELRLTETPISFILIPISVVICTFLGVVFLFKALNQRALVTVENVVQLAPRDIVQEVVRRHLPSSSPRSTDLIDVSSKRAEGPS